jgi:threonine dehydrogenase-like Zn-dependent dehydrogenase
VLRAEGATVVVVAKVEDVVRLEVASKLGFVAVSGEDLESAAPVGDFSTVVECSGADLGVATALRSTRKGEWFVQIGLTGHPWRLSLILSASKSCR